MKESNCEIKRMVKMKKWNEMRDYLIQGLVWAGTNKQEEMKSTLESALKKMDELDVKYHKKS